MLYAVIIAPPKNLEWLLYFKCYYNHIIYIQCHKQLWNIQRDQKICVIKYWIGRFIIKFFVLIFAGPYCIAILWYHWSVMKNNFNFTQMTYIIVIGLNTLLFTGDIAFGIYWIYCKLNGQDAHKFIKEFLKKDKRERRRLRRADIEMLIVIILNRLMMIQSLMI